jgi:DNA-binding MarR family transcriptional regulator
MTERQDPVEWSREQWIAHGQPAADQFTAMVAILRAHQAMTSSIDATLRTHDLTRTGYLLMTTLLLSRDATRPPGQLSRHLMVHPTTVTLALDQLEKRDLVKRNPHPTDRRTILAVLTPAGREVLDKATKALADDDFGLTGVGGTLAGLVVEVLGDVRERIGDVPAPLSGSGGSQQVGGDRDEPGAQVLPQPLGLGVGPGGGGHAGSEQAVHDEVEGQQVR